MINSLFPPPLFNTNQQISIAYFCAEFAIDDDLPIYSGGLGVLAGDVIRQASDDQMPLVGVGLFYSEGYFQQDVDDLGRQQHRYASTDPAKAGLTLVTDINNRPIILSIPYYTGRLQAQVWYRQAGNIKVYLIDANIEQNPEHLRQITSRLYTPDQETRIAQEILLGIGGVKLLRYLGIRPQVYHLNEGHSAFAIYELAAELINTQGLTFDQAVQQARQRVVFTNHTIVAAGNDLFPKHKVGAQLASYAEEQELPLPEMLALGLDQVVENSFSMTILALNSSTTATTVSKIHNQAARLVWPDYEFTSITNGVHIPTWLHHNWRQIWPATQPIDLRKPSDQQLLSIHQRNKQEMLQMVKKVSGIELSVDKLTLVWARRFAAYKRPNLIFQDIECLLRMCRQQGLQIIYAGKAHPNDKHGQDIFAEIHRMIRLHGLQDSIVVLPNYKMAMAKKLVSGADIWLNTPIRGQEASGTSGMKAGANGVLHVSISDGWMDEVNWRDIAWILPDENTADALFATLEHQVLPLYSQALNGSPAVWAERMRATMGISFQQFSSKRMMDEYREILYSPIFRLPDDF